MSSINNISGNSQVQKIVQNPIHREVSAPTASTTRGADKVELSGLQGMLKTLQAGGDVRTDKVAAIKAQIEAGTYEDDKKLDAAVDRMLDDVL